MNDLIDNVRTTGRIEFDGQDINDKAVDVIELRRRVGMVFQKTHAVPQIDLRKRGLRPAHRRACGKKAFWTRPWKKRPAPRRAMG